MPQTAEKWIRTFRDFIPGDPGLASAAMEEWKRANSRVDRHLGSNEEWLDRHQRACQLAGRAGPLAIFDTAGCLFPRTYGDRNLILAFDHLRREGGPAPGPDGVTFGDFHSRSDLCAFARQIRDVVGTARFEHGPTRTVRVPKASGHGTRPIQLLDLADRAVHRGVVQTVGPYLDLIFGDHQMYGGRPRLGREHALAFAEQLVRRGATFLVSEDLQDAFEHVPQRRLLDVLKKYIGCPRIVDLLRRLVVTPSGMGIRQGAASSPLFLNLYVFHHVLRPWLTQPGAPPLLTYIDDLLIPCRTMEEAVAARRRLETMLLPTGLRLKRHNNGANTTIDLKSGMDFEWLGFRMWCRDSQMQIGIGKRVCRRLEEMLAEMSVAHPADRMDKRRILSWVQQLGPAFATSDVPGFYDHVVSVAGRFGITDLPGFDSFAEAWLGGHERWLRIRQQVEDDFRQGRRG